MPIKIWRFCDKMLLKTGRFCDKMPLKTQRFCEKRLYGGNCVKKKDLR